ncbi:MAG: hypothetical protein Q7J44_12635 [Pseudotabrizicola sp.]|uniref:hypothetical protein n=1 Tax=Pseudotabrizicola sp. TaxID=2939647 RepID=UPI0027263E74|nr:hypothetical protein [Pseudotabrizicola sp.]MDO9639376.1 hypothetical protein [Pseudotabrizicola sp.]
MASGSEWNFGLDACDVDDKNRLKDFRFKADIWIRTLDRDDRNSVSSQILQMMWEDAAWRSLNHARYLSDGSDEIGTPGIVASLLDRGYVAGQAIAISRLLEKGASRPHKQVNSLRRLVDEIADCKELLTREVYVCRDGLPYDFNAVRERLHVAIDPENPMAVWLDNEGPEAWSQSMLLHEEFDKLSGVGPENRGRNDSISSQFFKRLQSAFDDPVFEGIQSLRHKSIAHAADDISRSSAKLVRDGITLDEIARSHYLLIGLFQVISANILQQSWLTDAIPVPQYNVFEGINRPIASEMGARKLGEFWDTHCSARSKWCNDAYREIIPIDFVFAPDQVT